MRNCTQSSEDSDSCALFKDPPGRRDTGSGPPKFPRISPLNSRLQAVAAHTKLESTNTMAGCAFGISTVRPLNSFSVEWRSPPLLSAALSAYFILDVIRPGPLQCNIILAVEAGLKTPTPLHDHGNMSTSLLH